MQDPKPARGAEPTSGGLLAHAGPQAADPKYARAASRTAEALIKEFATYPVYWQLGHAFDTLNDYFFTSMRFADAKEFGELALGKFLNRRSLPWAEKEDESRNPWWYDDFAWWGLAALRASTRGDLYGQTAGYFAGVAELSWQPVYRAAREVWRCAKWNPAWADFEPRHSGGVWNYLFAEHEIPGARFTPCRPGTDSLICIQNTVTNGLYWLLMARLARQRGDVELRTAADAARGFFKSWFGEPDDEISLLNHFDRKNREIAVVRERVARYHSSEKWPHGMPVHGFRPHLAWTGDQGLVLGALVDHMALVGRDDPAYPELLATVRKIAAGVLGYLVGPSPDRQLRPWAPYDGPSEGCPGGDCEDYLTGIGVFMRYLLYAYQENDDVKALLQELGYVELVRANAEHRINFRGTTFIELTNDLATFVAAVRMV